MMQEKFLMFTVAFLLGSFHFSGANPATAQTSSEAKGNSNLLLDKDAERIFLNGELIDSSWDTTGRNTRYARIVFEGRYWQCKDTNLLGDTVLLSCAALPKENN